MTSVAKTLAARARSSADRASVFGTESRGFKSCRARQIFYLSHFAPLRLRFSPALPPVIPAKAGIQKTATNPHDWKPSPNRAR